jgi:hypothetical protein
MDNTPRTRNEIPDAEWEDPQWRWIDVTTMSDPEHRFVRSGPYPLAPDYWNPPH